MLLPSLDLDSKLSSTKWKTKFDILFFLCYVMAMKPGFSYSFVEDVHFVCDCMNVSVCQVAQEAGIPDVSFARAMQASNVSMDVLEAFYSYAYRRGIRLNKVKEENYRENRKKGSCLLFHGSSNGIKKIDAKGSRPNCDFSYGFYCGEFYSSAVSFVEMDPHSSVYVFELSPNGLCIGEFQCDIEWRLTVCYYRGRLEQYKNSEVLRSLISKHQKDDLIIAPIANNKMFAVMTQFGRGEITTSQAIHALSASRLGRQFVFESKKAVDALQYKERLYLCSEEKEKSRKDSIERGKEIQTKLDFAKRQYRSEGLYIDEVFK